jgi:hypothetical protein
MIEGISRTIEGAMLNLKICFSKLRCKASKTTKRRGGEYRASLNVNVFASSFMAHGWEVNMLHSHQ